MSGKLIAVDLDDTLNNFTETLQTTPFVRDPSEIFSDEIFAQYLERLRSDRPDEGKLLSTEYSFFRARIHLHCYALARPRADGVAFLQALRRHGWQIILCTRRDLRRSHDLTRHWLAEHAIPFDHLFMAGNKIVFCSLWGIRHLVDDDSFNIIHGARYGVQVYYPAMAKHHGLENHGARAFKSFDELHPWIQE
jgi:5'(3')-deoxyribonucleotidase